MKIKKFLLGLTLLIALSSSIASLCSKNTDYFSRFTSGAQQALQQAANYATAGVQKLGGYFSSAGANISDRVYSLIQKMENLFQPTVATAGLQRLGFTTNHNQNGDIEKIEKANIIKDPIPQLNTKAMNFDELEAQVNVLIDKNLKMIESMASRINTLNKQKDNNAISNLLSIDAMKSINVINSINAINTKYPDDSLTILTNESQFTYHKDTLIRLRKAEYLLNRLKEQYPLLNGAFKSINNTQTKEIPSYIINNKNILELFIKITQLQAQIDYIDNLPLEEAKVLDQKKQKLILEKQTLLQESDFNEEDR